MDCALSRRSLQSRSLMKSNPEFWPVPAKLNPVTVITPSMDSFSCAMRYWRTRSSARAVRSFELPGGVCTCPIRKPASSGGRKEVGIRVYNRAMINTMPRYTSKERPECANIRRNPCS